MDKEALKGFFRKGVIKKNFDTFEAYELEQKKELISEIKNSDGGEKFLENLQKEKELISIDLIKDSFSLGQIYFYWIYRRIMTLASTIVLTDIDISKLNEEVTEFKINNEKGYFPIWDNLGNNLFYINEEKENQIGFLYYIKGSKKSYFDTGEQSFKTIYNEKIIYFNFYQDLGFGEIFSKNCNAEDISHFRLRLSKFGIKTENLNFTNTLLNQIYDSLEQVTTQDTETETLKDKKTRNNRDANLKQLVGRQNNTLTKFNGYFKYSETDSDKMLIHIKKGETNQFRINRETLIDSKRNKIAKSFIDKFLSNLTPETLIEDKNEALLHLFSNRINNYQVNENIQPVEDYTSKRFKIKCPQCNETQLIKSDELNRNYICINDNCINEFTPLDKDIVERYSVLNEQIFNQFIAKFSEIFEYNGKKFKFVFGNNFELSENEETILLIFNPHIDLKEEVFRLINPLNINSYYINLFNLLEIFENKKNINELFDEILEEYSSLRENDKVSILKQIFDEFKEILKKCKEEGSNESVIQNFIEKYPILLGINFCHFFPKKTFGNEHISDFTLIHNGNEASNITFVEIERYQKIIFKKTTDEKKKNITAEKVLTTSDFDNALKQIEDWEMWTQNPTKLSYFQEQLLSEVPNFKIRNPSFIQIVGFNDNFTQGQLDFIGAKNKQIKSWGGKIVTYDTLVYEFEKFIESLNSLELIEKE